MLTAKTIAAARYLFAVPAGTKIISYDGRIVVVEPDSPPYWLEVHPDGSFKKTPVIDDADR